MIWDTQAYNISVFLCKRNVRASLWRLLCPLLGLSHCLTSAPFKHPNIRCQGRCYCRFQYILFKMSNRLNLKSKFQIFQVPDTYGHLISVQNIADLRSYPFQQEQESCGRSWEIDKQGGCDLTFFHLRKKLVLQSPSLVTLDKNFLQIDKYNF